MSNFCTMEALTTLSTSIPGWNKRLDELNSQIARRQIELARLTDNERPSTRSIKNKGSTESLRPQDEKEEAQVNGEPNGDDYKITPYTTPPKSNKAVQCPLQRAAKASAAITRPLSKDSPDPRPSPNALARQSSQPTPPTQNRFGLRKRKTDSLASTESNVPKYRTRSMIIVYYDSTVQTAFEELVKFVSGSRNTMRKGKMNAKMAAMRRAAEREVNDDAEEDDIINAMLQSSGGNLLAAQKSLQVDISAKGPQTADGPLEADTNDVEMEIPKLKFVSTRNMGPSRTLLRTGADLSGNRISTGMLNGTGRSSPGEGRDIFDELDKGLEWCQGQCERAAHQFLRDGDCSDEIEGIKKKLLEVKVTSDKEMERLKQEEDSPVKDPLTPEREAFPSPRGRSLKTPQFRRLAPAPVAPTTIEVDPMEVDDDEGIEADIPKLVFKRSRDIGR